MIRVENLVKKFGEITAVDSLGEIQRMRSYTPTNGAISLCIGCWGEDSDQREAECFRPTLRGQCENAGLSVFLRFKRVRK